MARRVLIALMASATFGQGCFTSKTAIHVRELDKVAVDRKIDGSFEPLIAPGHEALDIEAAQQIRARRDATGSIHLLCPTCTLQSSATLVDDRGWTPWLEPTSLADGQIQLLDSFCGEHGAQCGGRSIETRISVPKSAVDEIRERRSTDALPGIITVLLGVAPAIIGPIIMLAPGVQSGDEGEEHPISTKLRLALGIPITALGVGLMTFGIIDLIWPDTENATYLR